MLIQAARDAETFLLNCWHDPSYGQYEPLVFEGCTLRIKLDPGKGEADFKMLRAVRLLQRHVDLTYTLAKRGDLSGPLTETEQARLSIVVTVRPGSTELSAGISGALKTIEAMLPAHWSTRTRGIVMSGVLLAVLAHPYVQDFWEYRADTDKAKIAADANVNIAEDTNRTNLEIARIQADAQAKVATVPRGQSSFGVAEVPTVREGTIVLAHLAKGDPSNIVAFALSDYVPWRPALMALAPYGGTIQWDGSAPIPARVAKAVAQVDREAATAARRAAKKNGHPGLIETPWVTEVLRTHDAPGAMRLGLTDA